MGDVIRSFESAVEGRQLWILVLSSSGKQWRNVGCAIRECVKLPLPSLWVAEASARGVVPHCECSASA